MDTVATEFDFVGALPKRELSRRPRFWDVFLQFGEESVKEGGLYPVMLAAKALDVSRTRVDEFVSDGRLKRVAIEGYVFITGNSVVELVKSERKNGRPCGRSVVSLNTPLGTVKGG